MYNKEHLSDNLLHSTLVFTTECISEKINSVLMTARYVLDLENVTFLKVMGCL
jgi:hypothetical protein